ncbi:hypothetical protein QR680_010953 [Steinernema hermaphroditum]|uniref:Uncharacterized protein n=1 Tax=Steinernema hermaphroditum TaxID=289476 RepID=A0AA39IQN4_9BILA|nr:hypothetical protein QR680_010953 [Steinernema hermaphroditum]
MKQLISTSTVNLQRKTNAEFYSLPAQTRKKIFSDLVTEAGPLIVLHYGQLIPNVEEAAKMKVTKLADYWMCGQEVPTKTYITSFDGTLPLLNENLDDWESWKLSSKYQLPMEVHAMEVPVALAHYRYRDEHYDVLCSKLFLTALTRFCEGNARSYRFDIELIGERILIEEAPLADASLGGTYSDSALSQLTGIKDRRQMYEIMKCSMGDLTCLYYSPVSIALETKLEKPNDVNTEIEADDKEIPVKPTFDDELRKAFPDILTTDDFIDTCITSFRITYSKVNLTGGLRPKHSNNTMELIVRRKEGFNPNSLLVRWPECFFSNSQGVVTVLHSKGQVAEQPAVHDPVYPPSHKRHLDLVAQTLRLLCEAIKSHAETGKTKFSLVWIDERDTDSSSPQKMKLYRRRDVPKPSALVLYEGMRKVVEGLKRRKDSNKDSVI